MKMRHNAPLLHIEGYVYPTVVNGPGRRVLVAVRGCSLKCPGCVNEDLWDRTGGGRYIDPSDLVDLILAETGLSIEEAAEVGITISGAEPMDQAASLFILLAKAQMTFKNVIVFTGYTLEEISEDPTKLACMEWLDAAATGRYDQGWKAAKGLKGSNNQEIIKNEYYQSLDIVELENFPHLTEIHPNGLTTGFPPEENDDVSLHSV